MLPADPIVYYKLFNDDQIKTASVVRKHAKNPPKELYMLRGRSKCGECWAMYSPSKRKYIHTSNKKEPYASHQSRSLPLKKDVVEQSVQEELLVLKHIDSEDVVQQHQENIKDLQAEMNRIAKFRQEIDTKKNRLRNLLYDEVFTED